MKRNDLGQVTANSSQPTDFTTKWHDSALIDKCMARPACTEGQLNHAPSPQLYVKKFNQQDLSVHKAR